MDCFSIADLQRYSGIKAHTIRIWEQRYNALSPQRSGGNTRYYDNNQLRRLLNIVSLSHIGYKVSDLGAMDDEELFLLLGQGITTESSVSKDAFYVEQLVAAGIGFDEALFERIFSVATANLGVLETYLQVIYPLLTRLGMMWQVNGVQPAQEHFITNIIKQKLHAAIDVLPKLQNHQAEKWLLFLPEDEFHEIGLLLANYVIRSYGKNTIYLGPNVPIKSVVNTFETTRASNVLFFWIASRAEENASEYLKAINTSLPNAKIYLSGNKKIISALSFKENIYWIKSIQELQCLFKE